MWLTLSCFLILISRVNSAPKAIQQRSRHEIGDEVSAHDVSSSTTALPEQSRNNTDWDEFRNQMESNLTLLEMVSRTVFGECDCRYIMAAGNRKILISLLAALALCSVLSLIIIIILWFWYYNVCKHQFPTLLFSRSGSKPALETELGKNPSETMEKPVPENEEHLYDEIK